MNPNDKISDYMTSCPKTVESGTKISEALRLMEDEGIRHLPVVEVGKVVGLLSERDIKRYEAFMDTTRTCAADVMVREPFSTVKTSSLSEVVQIMAKNKFGSAVVTGNGGQIVGIFTTTDVLELFSKAIQ